MVLPEIIKDRRFWVATGVTAVAAAGFAAWELTHQSPGVPATSVPEGAVGSFPTQESTPIPTKTATAIPAPPDGGYEIIYDGTEWSCAKVDPPTVPNAFRAIEAAGTPGVWEEGPYLYRHGTEEPVIVNNWNMLSLTYNGDDMCVTHASPPFLTPTPITQ